MPTSDEDLQKMQDEVQKLRDKVAAERDTAARRTRELDNDVTAANLQAEKARLEAELAVAKDSNKVSNVKAGAAGPLGAAQDQLSLAQAQAKMQEELRKNDAKSLEAAREATQAQVKNVAADQATTAGAPDVTKEN